MNKKLVLIFGMLFIIVIAGCDSNFLKIGSKGRPITDADIRQGTEGLTMEFTRNAPPKRVFEGGDGDYGSGIFPVAIKLENKGAYEIKSTEIKDINGQAENIVNGTLVFGFEKTYVDFNEDNKQELINEGVMDAEEKLKFHIKGKSIFNPKGGIEFITIDAEAKRIGEQSEKQPSVILATVCYPYKTIFGTSVCVDTDVYGIRQGQKACSVANLNFKKGQGAPVAVTKVETRILPQDENKVKLLFLIHIENKGNGEVVKLSETEKACTKEALNYRDFSTIIVNATLSGKFLDCRINKDGSTGPNQPAIIRLRDKKFMVRCILDDDAIDADIDAYITALSVELSYGYTFTISKNIIIEKILTY